MKVIYMEQTLNLMAKINGTNTKEIQKLQQLLN